MTHCTNINQLLRISFVLSIAYEFAYAYKVTAVLPCPIKLKCSSDPPLAWATDGRNCLVFQNDCQLRNQNCQRENSYEPTYTTIERDDCLKLCPLGCTKELNPVCTINNGVFRTFLNTCLWSQKMCQDDVAYVFQFRGRCEPEA